MRRAVMALCAVGVALLIGGAVLVVSPGPGGSSLAAKARPASQGQNAVRVGSAAGSIASGSGVSMRPERRSSLVKPRSEATAPPIGLTKRVKDDIRAARQGEAQHPADRPVLDAGALPSSLSTSGSENREPQPDTPALGANFQGMADTGWFPPDDQIAAGPNNILVATNGGVNILSKRGTTLSSQSLGGFFSPLGSEHSGAFDPWAVYDPYLNRFWLLATSRDTTTQRSDILIALSNNQDATLGWTMWELDATVNGATEANQWCDYPKLGFDNQQIYVTCNMFAFGGGFQYSKLRIMSKNQFVNNTGIFWWDFWDLREGGSGTAKAFTVQPAQMFGASGSEGGFLVSARGGGNSGSALDVWRITNQAECCNGDSIGPNLANQGQSVGGYDRSDGARQPPDSNGNTLAQINDGDSRLLYATWKGGRLSTGQTVACGSGGTDACGGFTELNVSGYPTISTLNNWVLTAGGQDVYYPAVSVNGADDKTMVFSVSDSSLLPSAAYVGIPSSTDCTNCLDGSTTLLRAGQNSYVRLDSSGRNRWGDYSGVSPDPNGEGIWVAGEFSAASVNTWGVQAGLTYQTSPPPINDDLSGSQFISGTSISAGGTNRYATRQVGEPDHLSFSGSLGEHSVWYSWIAPFSGPVTLNTCTSNFDTVLAVYSGFSIGSLSQVASNDDACGTGSQLSFNAVSGTTYRFAVAGFSSSSEGTFTLGLKMPPQNDNFANAQAPSGFSATANGTTLAATRESGEPDHYVTNPPDSDLWVGDHSVWYSWSAPFTGKVEINTCTSNIDGILAVYTGSSLSTLSRIDDDNNGCPNNPDGSTNWGSKLTVNATKDTTYRIAVADAGGLRENTFTLKVIDRKPPKVNSTTPANNATGVLPGANVKATFSEDMRATSVINSFKLFRAGTSTTIGAAVTYDAANKRATLNPNNNLVRGAKYKAVVTTQARDLAGNQLDQDANTTGNQSKTWFFTVQP